MLNFKCPKCGNTKLQSFERINTFFDIDGIHDDGSFEYGLEKQENGEVIAVQCINSECDFELPTLAEQELVDWLKENCPQDNT